jgi:hypothetical protein
LAYRNVLEVLVCLAGGPEDIDAIDCGVMAQSDVLLDRVCAEGTALADGSEDSAWLASVIRHGDFDLGAQGLAVCFNSDKTQVDPIVFAGAIAEDAHGMLVSGYGTTDLGNYIFVPTTVEVGKGNAMTFVKFTRAGRGGDVDEGFSCVVSE